MIDRQKIKAALLHGSQREIARRSGATSVSVSRWFSGVSNDPKIADAALALYAEAVAMQQQQQAKFEAALRGEKI